MSGEDRELIFLVLSSLMVAEERITTKFSGLVGAYGSEEEATFLATQQVDEARHMQFYARFQDEVVADPAAIAAHVARAREQVSAAFRPIFDVALVEAHEQLVAEPRGPRRQGPLRDPLPPDPRGNARPDDLQVHHRLPSARGAAARVRRGLPRSTTTSRATSATGSGSCARPSPRIPTWPMSCGRCSATCCLRWPRRSPRPTRARPGLRRDRRERRGDPGFCARRAHAAPEDRRRPILHHLIG